MFVFHLFAPNRFPQCCRRKLVAIFMSLFEARRASRASIREKPISTNLATCGTKTQSVGCKRQITRVASLKFDIDGAELILVRSSEHCVYLCKFKWNRRIPFLTSEEKLQRTEQRYRHASQIPPAPLRQESCLVMVAVRMGVSEPEVVAALGVGSVLCASGRGTTLSTVTTLPASTHAQSSRLSQYSKRIFHFMTQA